MPPFLLLLLLQVTEVESKVQLSQLEGSLWTYSGGPQPSVVYQLFDVSGFLHRPPDLV